MSKRGSWIYPNDKWRFVCRFFTQCNRAIEALGLKQLNKSIASGDLRCHLLRVLCAGVF